MSGSVVTVAAGVEVPADLAALLDGIDAAVDAATAPGGLGDRSPERAQALVLIEYARRRLAAASARVITAADDEGDHLGDGHPQVRGWVGAHVDTSRSEAVREVQLAALGRAHPVVLALLAAGALGVAQARLLAAAYANPRIRDSFDDRVSWLCDLATTHSYEVFAGQLHTWVQLADQDGSAPDPHDERRAHLATVGSTTYLDLAVDGVAGAEVAEVLDRFTQAEFHAEWDRLAAVHGDAMCAGLLERTSAQRRADAVVAVFRAAAGAPTDAIGPSPVVNIVVPQHVFEEQSAAMVENRPARFDLSRPAELWCATTKGIPVAPAEAVAAALVGHVRRVVIDRTNTIIGFGRRRRLFAGSSRDAAAVQFLLQTSGRCLWPGCGRSHLEIDHATEFAAHGPTELTNAAPLCARHNRLKNQGYRTWRDRLGRWCTARPDGLAITPV